MTAQNCVHLHARVVVPKHEFSIVDQRKIALVNELRNFRTVTSKVSSFKYSISLQLNDGSEKTQQTAIPSSNNQENARACEGECF